jgi:hypothetical protein
MTYPWITATGQVEFNTCKQVEAYLLHQTNIKVDVHKTSRYLIIQPVNIGDLKPIKVELTGGVLYCVSESDLTPAIFQLKANKKPTYKELEARFEKLKRYLLLENETIETQLVELEPYDIYDNSNACKQNFLYGKRAVVLDILQEIK